MPGEIKKLEIFAAGTWTTSSGQKVTISNDDLEDIVKNFDILKDSNIVKPHLKLGHTDAQKWFGQKNGIPTLGWIDQVWAAGGKLFANIVNVPNEIIDLIKNGRYHNVSAEVFPKGVIKHNGAAVGPVLSAVALLGTEMPAVKTLAGLASALFADQFNSPLDKEPERFTKGEKGMYTQEQVDALVDAAVSKAVTKAKDEFSAEQDSIKTQLEVATRRAVDAEKALNETKKAFEDQRISSIIETAIKAGKILPAQKDMVTAFAANMKEGTMNFGGKELSRLEMFEQFMNSFGKQVDLTERGSGNNSGGKADSFSTAAEEVDFKAKEMIRLDTSGKLDYAAAFKKVLSADADLKERYAGGSN